MKFICTNNRLGKWCKFLRFYGAKYFLDSTCQIFHVIQSEAWNLGRFDLLNDKKYFAIANDTEICTVEFPIVQPMKSLQCHKKAAFTLAEGPRRTGYCSFCHPELVSGSKKQMLKQVQHDIITRKELIHFKSTAFSLAEVLITIGIIGVVAAMTIPPLRTKIEFFSLKSQFKKEYSQLVNSIRLMNEEQEKEYLCYAGNTNECSEFWEEYFKRRKVGFICDKGDYKCRPKYKSRDQVISEGGVGNPSCSLVVNEHTGYVILNGAIYYIWVNPFQNYFAIDINGTKGPNRFGYDLFYMTLDKEQGKFERPVTITQSTCFLREKGGYTIKDMLK